MNLLCVDFFALLSQNICFQEKTLLDYSSVFSANDYSKDDKIMYKYFKDKHGRRSKSRVWIEKN